MRVQSHNVSNLLSLRFNHPSLFSIAFFQTFIQLIYKHLKFRCSSAYFAKYIENKIACVFADIDVQLSLYINDKKR